MAGEKRKLREIIDLGIEMNQIADLDVLLERILLRARSLVNAEAGSIYIREETALRFKYTQNEALQKKLPPGRKLVYSTFSLPLTNESLAGYAAGTGEMLNIPDVYHLPGNVPFSFDRNYDLLSGYRTQSVLTFPLKTARGDIIGVLQLINARDKKGKITAFAKDDESFVLHFAASAAIAIERAAMTRDIILRMIQMAELRDPKETGAHVNRVASYAVEIYEAWARGKGVPAGQIDRNIDVLRLAAMLHDVGKIAISDLVLKKPSRLTPDEFEIIKHHTFLGARLFTNVHSEFDEAARSVALNHHERWDGTGYPGYINVDTGRPIAGYERDDGRARGKAGEEIPPFGRVVAIADVYDALSSHRVYKEPWDESAVLENIRSEAGRQFDPDMVAAFFSSLDVIRSIAQRYPDR